MNLKTWVQIPIVHIKQKNLGTKIDACVLNIAWRKERQADPWNSLSDQSSQIGKFQTEWEAQYEKKIIYIERAVEEDMQW